MIGAGAAGLCAAKTLLEAGLEVTVFEAGSCVGGLWVYNNDNGRSPAYRTLSIISSRRYTNFPDFPFDGATPAFPTHWDMHRYLESYARHFGVTPHISFNCPVTTVRPEFDPGREQPVWRVCAATGYDNTYDGVVVATGHLTEPRHDDRFRAFAGEYLHSRVYRVPDPFVRKRVCVVGAGNSGTDIASGVCHVAERTVLVARSGIVIIPRVIAGIPFADIAVALRRKWIPEWLRARVVRAIIFTAHGDLTRLGFQRPHKKVHPTFSESIIMNIQFNRITVKPDIVAINGSRRHIFADGTREPFDVLIGATGYKVHLPFLAPDVLPIQSNHVDLYKRIFVPGWPGLTFVGMINPLVDARNRIFHEQSRAIAQYYRGDVTLPGARAMQEDVERKNRRTATAFTSSPRHELEEPDFNYVDELRVSPSRGKDSSATSGFSACGSTEPTRPGALAGGFRPPLATLCRTRGTGRRRCPRWATAAPDARARHASARAIAHRADATDPAPSRSSTCGSIPPALRPRDARAGPFAGNAALSA